MLSILSRSIPQVLALSCISVLVACDAQVTTAYRGEALLTMSGSVGIAHGSTAGTLRPALAFFNQEQAEIQIVDVDAQGEFPAEFTIRVYDPPPPAAITKIAEDIARPRAAVAYITAVTAAHPDTIKFAASGVTNLSPSTCNGGPCDCGPGGCVREQTSVCTADEKNCYTETVTCPQSDSPSEACTVTHSGDSWLKESPWKSFAGLSQNYMIVYLTEALAAGTRGALALGTQDDLEQGYNLLSMRALTIDEQIEQENCARDSEAVALARFNRQHGTSYDQLQIFGLTCVMGPVPCPMSMPGCAQPVVPDCPPPASSDEIDAYQQLVTQVKTEQRCSDAGLRTTRVSDPEQQRVAVESRRA